MRLSFVILALFTFFSSQAQLDPVGWSFSSEQVSANEYKITCTAQTQSGWAIYSQHLGDEGPIPTTFEIKQNDGQLTAISFDEPEGVSVYDEMFDMEIIKFKGKVIFTKVMKLDNNSKTLDGSVFFMTCDDKRCLPPKDVPFSINL